MSEVVINEYVSEDVIDRKIQSIVDDINELGNAELPFDNVLQEFKEYLETKADKADVLDKASKYVVDKLRSNVEKILADSTKLSTLETKHNELASIVSGKANKAVVDKSLKNIKNDIATTVTKAELSDVLNSISLIRSRLTNIESDHEEDIFELNEALNDLECNVLDSINSFGQTLNAQTKKINEQQESIDKLEIKDEELSESVKNEWVKVMTPEAYKKLPTIGAILPDGSPDPRAKKANTIYMLVRYSKPIAVYIGDILIAQAEQKGSTGFAYNFPIIF